MYSWSPYWEEEGRQSLGLSGWVADPGNFRSVRDTYQKARLIFPEEQQAKLTSGKFFNVVSLNKDNDY